jgi:hypothetical protein
MIEARIETTHFMQKVGESFSQSWRRFSILLNKVHNHGFFEYVIIQYLYNGPNSESKQMIDSSA